MTVDRVPFLTVILLAVIAISPLLLACAFVYIASAPNLQELDVTQTVAPVRAPASSDALLGRGSILQRLDARPGAASQGAP